MAETRTREEDIFHAALDIDVADRRSAYLDAACGNQEELRRRVEALLRRYAETVGPLDRPVVGPAATTDQPVADQPSMVLGPYKLLEQIGEGGMGTVFMAEQTHPVQRKVALKVIKAGMDSRQVIARFEAERQALAMMDHVNIARVLDAGATEAGRPYFVMELVHGVPITRYCDDNRLTPRERLELFVPVCRAIQHAHQKGIIHRDIKPSNVMITLYDGKPVPKVIDFGIAKATEQRLTERTLFTQYGTMVGTLEYMSPEQAEMSALGVDTRSDIYSLGVLLYELLTGSTPLSHKRLKEAAYAEVLHMIKEEEPPRPSTRLSDSGEALASISANRHTEPAKLTKLVRGELDWIVMKCLEKDRNRRYETANGFAADVQRYLNDEPVQACPPSAGYRLRKFTRRNKRALAMAALLGVMLLAAVGAVAGTIGWALGEKASRLAKISDEVDQALEEAMRFQLQGKYAQASVAIRRAEGLATAGGVRADLHQRVWQVRATLAVVADLDEARLGKAKVKDGHFDDSAADHLYAKALRDYGLDVATLDPQTAAARINASGIREQLLAALEDLALLVKKRGDNEGRERLLTVVRLADPNGWRHQFHTAILGRNQEVLKTLAARPDVLDQPPAMLQLLGKALGDSGAPTAAVKLLRQAQQRHPDDFWLNHELAITLCDLKPARDGEGIGFFRAALALRAENPGVYHNLAIVLSRLGQPDEAIANYRKATQLKPDYAQAYYGLGYVLEKQGKLDDAIAEYRKSVEAKEDYALGHYGLGVALENRDRLPEAVAAYRKAVHHKKDFAEAHAGLGSALTLLTQLPEAETSLRRAIVLNPHLYDVHSNLGNILKTQNKLLQAIDCYNKAIKIRDDVAAVYNNLGAALTDLRRFPEAIRAYRKAIELDNKHAKAYYNLGIALSGQGEVRQAADAYRAAIKLEPDDAEAHCNLGQALRNAGQFAEALAALRRGHELGRKTKGWPHPSAHWVKECERLVELDGMLAATLRGTAPPAKAADRFGIAEFCLGHKRLPVTAARLYAAALAADLPLAEDKKAVHLYNAACAAALAGSGKGDAAAKLDDQERARWRKQALDWLRAALAVWTDRAEKGTSADRAAIQKRMRHWQKDADLAGLRDPDALAHLPEAERDACRKLWADVEALLTKGKSKDKEAPRDKP